jgi:hypothetical protein
MTTIQDTPPPFISPTRSTGLGTLAGACCLFLVAASAPSGHAAVVSFSTDFESDTIGSEPAGFAGLVDTGFAGQSLDVIGAESPFVGGPGSATTGGPGSQALQWLDNNATDSNPDIVVFDLATGTRLDLDNGGTIKNNGVGDTLEFTGSGLARWHALEITTNLANNTYDLVMQRQDRASPLTFNDLPFNNSVSNIGSMQFNDFGGASSTSEYYLDNISAVSVPEPSTSVLLTALLGVSLLRRHRRECSALH